MVTAILKIIEMMLLKFLTNGGKSFTKNNALCDKYNEIGKLFYM
jgi:hypothetical protein